MLEMKFDSLELRKFGNDEVNSVLARELYKDLYKGKGFRTWIQKRIQRLEKNVDYLEIGDPNELGYHEIVLSLDTAKALALMAETEEGDRIRQYFINVEKIAKNVIGEKKLELELKKLEIDMENYQVESTLKQVKMLQDFGINYDPISLVNSDSLRSKLPEHIGNAISIGVSDIRPNAPIKSCTVLLKEFNVQILTKDFNEKLVELGILEEYFYNGKRFRKLSDEYRWYGRNLKFSSVRELPYDLKYYIDRFSQLIALVRNEGYID